VSLIRPLPRPLARILTGLVLVAWVLQMAVLAHHAFSAAPVALAADLAQYGSSAQWRGVYYRGDKIGFSVGQTTPTASGYEIREDGRLQMTLLGATTAVRLSSDVLVDRAFNLERFSFSLDPGTGPTEVRGRLEGRRLQLTIHTLSGERTETRVLPEPPALALNLPRMLAARGLHTGQRIQVSVFDPATLRNAPMTLEVKAREVVHIARRPVPAFRVESHFAGITTNSWITDVGEVVREESPTGLLVVRETPGQAQALAVPGQVQTDLLEAAALVPTKPVRIDDPTTVARLRVRIDGIEGFGRADLQGAGQTLDGTTIEVRDPRDLRPAPRTEDLAPYLRAEPFIESDAPEILTEAQKAVASATRPRQRAERLVRYVHSILEKKPTVSIPSALEVLRTRVGDCNEHTALYVAMARALGIPARVAVGLVYLRGAFYYHAWPEVWIAEGRDRGLWLPVDPTLDQFPADATHVRLARGGLERQAGILGLVGHARLEVTDLELRPGAVPILVGRPATDLRSLDLPLPSRDGSGPGCWSSPRRLGRRR
jgi:transglutaminase-like putative cysteine protease